ncbi:hypothetical protein GCM10010399_29710 [Dactylosporangium fulvum]|uniref:Glycoside hydrolase family 16 protein n=1 Tax=Dactylosporangium fulvum TaxID=53359 RepID=A0ABY5W1P0_9ACTN|nr:glycoside hydrolase family 16 protein [Dactylosporangium fulvum]UWP83830.1 glycoside hydrolase family 16 protein [Dactylosporangium fulvum]
MLRRAAAVVVVVASITCVSPARADAADPPGWTPVFSQSFDDAGALPSGCSAYDGAPDGTQAGYFRPEAVTVSDGRLRLALHRRAYGGKPYVTGEVRCLGATQQYGRYEFRARVPTGAGIESVVMLRPVDGQARDVSQLAILARPGDETAVVSNGNGSGTSTKMLPGTFSDWHTYVIEWAPSGFRISVDGRERSADPAVSTQPRWFGFAVTTGDKAGTPTAATALPAEFEVDYLRIWAFAPVSSAPAVASSPTTVEGALPPGGAPPRRWSLWLAVSAIVMSGLALFVLVVRKTRPRRPPSSHRI